MAKKKRKNCPGNFRQQTPEAARRFMNRWAKVKDANGQPITVASQIKVGVGGLDNEKDANLAKIKFKQAMDIVAHFDKRLQQFESKLETHKENMRQWRECKAQGIDLEGCGLKKEMLRRPSKPTGKSRADKGCAGNFKTPSKHASVRYLKHFFSKLRPDIKKFIPEGNASVFQSFRGVRGKVGPRGSAANFIPRIREAMEVVGVAEAAKIANDVAQHSLQKALDKVIALDEKLAKSDESLSKVEAKQAKKVEATKKRLLARKEKLQKDKEKLSKYVDAVSARRRKNRKLRRR